MFILIRVLAIGSAFVSLALLILLCVQFANFGFGSLFLPNPPFCRRQVDADFQLGHGSDHHFIAQVSAGLMHVESCWATASVHPSRSVELLSALAVFCIVVAEVGNGIVRLCQLRAVCIWHR